MSRGPLNQPAKGSDWDTRVVFVENKRRWWWNAWRPVTSTELYGFTDTQIDAWQALADAIDGAAQVPDQLEQRRRRTRHGSGTA